MEKKVNMAPAQTLVTLPVTDTNAHVNANRMISEKLTSKCSCVRCPITPEGINNACVCSGLCLGLGEGVGFKVTYNDFLPCEVVSLKLLKTMELLATSGQVIYEKFDTLFSNTKNNSDIKPSTISKFNENDAKSLMDNTDNNEEIAHMDFACNYRVTASAFKAENVEETEFKQAYSLQTKMQHDLKTLEQEQMQNVEEHIVEEDIINNNKNSNDDQINNTVKNIDDHNNNNLHEDDSNSSNHSDSASAGDLSDTNESSNDSFNPFRQNATSVSPATIVNSSTSNNNNHNNNSANKRFRLTAMNLHYMELRNLHMEMQVKDKEEKY